MTSLNGCIPGIEESRFVWNTHRYDFERLLIRFICTFSLLFMSNFLNTLWKATVYCNFAGKEALSPVHTETDKLVYLQNIFYKA